MITTKNPDLGVNLSLKVDPALVVAQQKALLPITAVNLDLEASQSPEVSLEADLALVVALLEVELVIDPNLGVNPDLDPEVDQQIVEQVITAKNQDLDQGVSRALEAYQLLV